jgi:hypothetical protein
MSTSATDVLAEIQAYHSRRSFGASVMMVLFFAVVMLIFWLRISEERERAVINVTGEQALQDLRGKRVALEQEQQFLAFLNSPEPAEFSAKFSELVDQERRAEVKARIDHLKVFTSRLCVDVGSIDLLPAAIQPLEEKLASADKSKQELGRALCNEFAGGRFAQFQAEAMELREVRPTDGVNGCYRRLQTTNLFRTFSQNSIGYSASVEGERCRYGEVESYLTTLLAPQYELIAERYTRAKVLAKKRLEDAALAVKSLEEQVNAAAEAFTLATGRLQKLDATFWWTLAIHVFFTITAFLGINASYQLARQHNFETVEIQRRRTAMALTGGDPLSEAKFAWPDNPFHPNFKIARLKTPHEEFIRNVVKEAMQIFKEQSKRGHRVAAIIDVRGQT